MTVVNRQQDRRSVFCVNQKDHYNKHYMSLNSDFIILLIHPFFKPLPLQTIRKFPPPPSAYLPLSRYDYLTINKENIIIKRAAPIILIF